MFEIAGLMNNIIGYISLIQEYQAVADFSRSFQNPNCYCSICLRQYHFKLTVIFRTAGALLVIKV